MNGFAHSSIGAATGFVVSTTTSASPITTLILIGAGALSALVPDLDTNGKLANSITIPYKFLKFLVLLSGLILLYITWFQHNGLDNWTGSIIGIVLILASRRLKQRFMLSITGIGVVWAGVYLVNLWMILLGIYVIVASFLKHRGYTHSVLGLIYFTYIAYLFASEMEIPSLFQTTVLGYASHLIADMKWIPFNKQGVKLFMPFSQKSF